MIKLSVSSVFRCRDLLVRAGNHLIRVVAAQFQTPRKTPVPAYLLSLGIFKTKSLHPEIVYPLPHKTVEIGRAHV